MLSRCVLTDLVALHHVRQPEALLNGRLVILKIRNKMSTKRLSNNLVGDRYNEGLLSDILQSHFCSQI